MCLVPPRYRSPESSDLTISVEINHSGIIVRPSAGGFGNGQTTGESISWVAIVLHKHSEPRVGTLSFHQR